MVRRSIEKNYVYNVSYQLLVLITPLITTPYLSRVLGADGIGTASYIESIVSYFTLFATLGMTTFGQREISYVQDNKEKRTQIFWETNILEVITASIAIVVYIVFSLNQNSTSLYLVLVFNIISVVANVSWFFQGLEDFGCIVLRNVVFKIINIAYIFLVIHTKNDLIWYLFGSSFFTFLSNVSLWIYVPKYVGRPNWKMLHPFRHVKTIIMLFIPTVAVQIYTVLDKTMIGLITDNAYENGYYEQAYKISKMVMTIITSLGTVMIPRIGFEYQNKHYDDVKRLMYRGYQFVWCLGIPLCFGLIAISDNFVPWFFGIGYDKVADLIKILAFLILAIGINNVTGMQYLIPTKRENTFTLTVVIGAITNFVLNLFLIYFFQSAGAAVASVTAETTIAVVQIWIVRKELSPIKILTIGKHYLISGLLMLAILLLLGAKMSSSVINTFFMVVLGAGVYFILLAVMKDEFFLINVKKLFDFLKRKVDKK